MKVPPFVGSVRASRLIPVLWDAYEYNYTDFSDSVPTPFFKKGWENEVFSILFDFLNKSGGKTGWEAIQGEDLP